MIFKEQLSKIHDLEYVVKVVTVCIKIKKMFEFLPQKIRERWMMFLLKSFQMKNYTFFKSQLVFIFW